MSNNSRAFTFYRWRPLIPVTTSRRIVVQLGGLLLAQAHLGTNGQTMTQNNGRAKVIG
jgi:hypothetical protein